MFSILFRNYVSETSSNQAIKTQWTKMTHCEVSLRVRGLPSPSLPDHLLLCCDDLEQTCFTMEKYLSSLAVAMRLSWTRSPNPCSDHPKACSQHHWPQAWPGTGQVQAQLQKPNKKGKIKNGNIDSLTSATSILHQRATFDHSNDTI